MTAAVGTGFPPGALAQHDQEVVADALPHAVLEEGAHIPVHGAPGREGRRRRQVAPLAAGAHEVEQAVQQVPHVYAPRPPSVLGGRDQRLQEAELVIRKRLAGAEIPNQRAISGRPHGGLQAGNRVQRRSKGQDQPVKPTETDRTQRPVGQAELCLSTGADRVPPRRPCLLAGVRRTPIQRAAIRRPRHGGQAG